MASPALGLRKAFTPNYAAVDWSHPLSQRLEFCGVPSLGLDLAKMRPATSVAASGQTYELLPSRYGQSLIANWSNASTTDLAFTSGPFTLAVVSNLSGTSTAYNAFARRVYVDEANNQGWGMQLRFLSPLGANFQSLRNNSVTFWQCTPSSTIATGSYVHVGRSNGTNFRELFQNGLRIAATSANANPVDSSGDLILGSQGATTSIGLAWSRFLTNVEIAQLTADPFCMLRY